MGLNDCTLHVPMGLMKVINVFRKHGGIASKLTGCGYDTIWIIKGMENEYEEKVISFICPDDIDHCLKLFIYDDICYTKGIASNAIYKAEVLTWECLYRTYGGYLSVICIDKVVVFHKSPIIL